MAHAICAGGWLRHAPAGRQLVLRRRVSAVAPMDAGGRIAHRRGRAKLSSSLGRRRSRSARCLIGGPTASSLHRLVKPCIEPSIRGVPTKPNHRSTPYPQGCQPQPRENHSWDLSYMATKEGRYPNGFRLLPSQGPERGVDSKWLHGPSILTIAKRGGIEMACIVNVLVIG